MLPPPPPSTRYTTPLLSYCTVQTMQQLPDAHHAILNHRVSKLVHQQQMPEYLAGRRFSNRRRTALSHAISTSARTCPSGIHGSVGLAARRPLRNKPLPTATAWSVPTPLPHLPILARRDPSLLSRSCACATSSLVLQIPLRVADHDGPCVCMIAYERRYCQSARIRCGENWFFELC